MSRALKTARLATQTTGNFKNLLEGAVSCQKRFIRTTQPLLEGPVVQGRLPSSLQSGPLRPVVSDTTVAQLHEAEVARLVALLNLSSSGGGGGGSSGGTGGGVAVNPAPAQGLRAAH